MGIYRPRSPQNVSFYQCIADHFEEFVQVYDECYEREYGFWRPVISEVIQKFLECGDLAHGFVRIRCDHCGQTLLLALPKKDNVRLPQIINYLSGIRSIPMPLIKSLIHSGKLYADHRGNAVFLLLGKEKSIVGAELRGTSHIRWQGMAPGSRKDLGCFCINHFNTRKMVLCESAIDAISLFSSLVNYSTFHLMLSSL